MSWQIIFHKQTNTILFIIKIHLFNTNTSYIIGLMYVIVDTNYDWTHVIRLPQHNLLVTSLTL